MPGSTDKGRDLGCSWEAHLGDREDALGLRSHGYWAAANLAPYTVSIPGSWAPAPNTVLLVSVPLNHGRPGLPPP